MNAAAETLGRCHFMQFCNGYDIMKKIRMSQVPWAIMLNENNCEHCERLPKCTYKDLMLCFISNVDYVTTMTKEETEELEKK